MFLPINKYGDNIFGRYLEQCQILRAILVCIGWEMHLLMPWPTRPGLGAIRMERLRSTLNNSLVSDQWTDLTAQKQVSRYSMWQLLASQWSMETSPGNECGCFYFASWPISKQTKPKMRCNRCSCIACKQTQPFRNATDEPIGCTKTLLTTRQARSRKEKIHYSGRFFIETTGKHNTGNPARREEVFSSKK